jgi:phytoene dehydrogenase-like protein
VKRRAVIIGGGVAGLCCARLLLEAGIETTLLEASDRLGGRVASDVVDGFTLDRGFQILLTAYPQNRRFLDLQSLDLRSFEPGATIWWNGRRHRFVDALRRPMSALETLRSPVATFADKRKILKVRAACRSEGVDMLIAREESRTIDLLRRTDFSDGFVERFFRPFYAGVFLESELATSSRCFEFTFRMFSQGSAAVPSRGMGAIAQQLAQRLPQEFVRLESRVEMVVNRAVMLESGEAMLADAIVLAVDRDTASYLSQGLIEPAARWNSTICVWLAYEDASRSEPLLLLNGSGEGQINHVAVMNDVSPEYAPPGMRLACANIVGRSDLSDDQLESLARREVSVMLGWDASRLSLVRIDRIEKALPDQRHVHLRPARVRQGLYVCGDWCDMPSINGAMASAVRAADAVIKDVVE